jgi:catechol-2,3-dioxygenase
MRGDAHRPPRTARSENHCPSAKAEDVSPPNEVWHMSTPHNYGRLIDHVHLRVADLEASRRSYRAVLRALGLDFSSSEEHFSTDELWVDLADGPVGIHPMLFV